MAGPGIVLPINSQVPPVARISKPFSFVFSESTFSSSSPSMDYSLSNSPSWLQLDSSSRRLYGTPGSEDAGAPSMNLIATDGTGPSSMAVTLIVSSDPGPRLGIPVSDQLLANGAFSSPSSLLISHSSSLHLSFSKSTFTNTNDKTVYYALCANNTPLPSWIHFDASSLSFSGTSPESTSSAELSQTYDIHLTASDVAGFSGAIASFQLVLESHIFAFGKYLQIINATQGAPFNLGLQTDLTLDNSLIKTADLGQVVADTPDWVTFDKNNLVLSGIPPASAASQNITVTATDTYGDVAITVVQILLDGVSPVQFFQGPIGPLNAIIGDDFEYTLDNSLFTSANLEVSADLGNATSWLSFDPVALKFHGSVPSTIQPQQDLVNITASQGGQSQSQEVTIAIKRRDNNSSAKPSSSQNSEPTAVSSPIGPSKSPPATSAVGVAPKKHWLPAAVLVPIAIVLGFLIAALFYIRKRRQRRFGDEPFTHPPKEKISRPIAPDSSWVTVNDDDETAERMDPSRRRKSSKPPKIDLSGFLQSGPNNRRSRIRSSRTTTDSGRPNPKLDQWREYFGDIDHAQPESAVVSEARLFRERSPLRREIGNQSSHMYSSSESLLVESVPPIRRGKRQGKSRSGMIMASSHGLFSTQHLQRFGRAASGMGHGMRLTEGAFGPMSGGPPGFGLVRGSWRNTMATNASTTDFTTTTTTTTTTNSSSRRPAHKPSAIFSSLVEAFPPTPTSKSVEAFFRTNYPLLPAPPTPPRTTIRLINPSPKRSLGAAAGDHSLPSSSTSRAPVPKDPSSALDAFHKQRLSARHWGNPLFHAHPPPSQRVAPSARFLHHHRRSASLSSSQRFGSVIAAEDYDDAEEVDGDMRHSFVEEPELEEGTDELGRKVWRHVGLRSLGDSHSGVDDDDDDDAFDPDAWTDVDVDEDGGSERAPDGGRGVGGMAGDTRLGMGGAGSSSATTAAATGGGGGGGDGRVVLGNKALRPVSVVAGGGKLPFSGSVKGEIVAFL